MTGPGAPGGPGGPGSLSGSDAPGIPGIPGVLAAPDRRTAWGLRTLAFAALAWPGLLSAAPAPDAQNPHGTGLRGRHHPAAAWCRDRRRPAGPDGRQETFLGADRSWSNRARPRAAARQWTDAALTGRRGTRRRDVTGPCHSHQNAAVSHPHGNSGAARIRRHGGRNQRRRVSVLGVRRLAGARGRARLQRWAGARSHGLAPRPNPGAHFRGNRLTIRGCRRSSCRRTLLRRPGGTSGPMAWPRVRGLFLRGTRLPLVAWPVRVQGRRTGDRRHRRHRRRTRASHRGHRPSRTASHRRQRRPAALGGSNCCRRPGRPGHPDIRALQTHRVRDSRRAGDRHRLRAGR